MRRAAISFGFVDLLEAVSQLLERECTMLPGNAHPDAALQLTHAANVLKTKGSFVFSQNIMPLRTNFSSGDWSVSESAIISIQHCFDVESTSMTLFNPSTAKLFNWNFHSLEVVSRWCDSQLQVSENYSDLTKLRSTILKFCCWCHILSLTS